ncbi:MAG: PEP-CTERM sorting domain-containing protein [Pirellulales bacterium]|nr:PEP-CTERM sorting domain-containing protein [Pirellulales bacterium]
MKKFVLSGLFISALATLAQANPVVIVDTTPGTAVNDGTINGGEYVGLSRGINAGFGNVIGSQSELHVDSSLAGDLNFGLRQGGGNLFNQGVIYIDSIPGGFTSTASFTDGADPLRRAISGFNGFGGSGNTLLLFAPGFEADYAIGIESGFAGLWQLSAGSHTFLSAVNLTPTGNPNASAFEINTTLASIGVPLGGSFDYVMTYLNANDGGGPFRSDEFHGVKQATVPGGNIGQAALTLAQGDYNTFVSIPEPSTWVLLGLGSLLAGWSLKRRV